MFEFWWDIEQNFEVFLFMCGIMEDPSPVIDHMCEQYVNNLKGKGGYVSVNERHLCAIYKEINNKSRFLNPFCNEHFYHVWQLPLKRQSKFYFFSESLDWLEIESNARTIDLVHNTDADIFDCGVVIFRTHLPPHDVLKAISTLRQTISVIHIGEPFILTDEACDNIPDHIFKIDPSATHIHIDPNFVLPKAISKDLGREISTCYNLSYLNLANQPLVAAEITAFLGTNRNLRTLDVEDCDLSENKVYKICEQLSQLSNLELCYLSGNAVGDAVSVLSQSIKSWDVNSSLRTLYLRDCNITPGGCSRLLEALGVCTNLDELVLSYNTIGGVNDGLSSVLAESIKSWGVNTSLSDLCLEHCNITPDGCSRLLEALGVCTNLQRLNLSDNAIGGAFDALISKPVYPRLSHLCLRGTPLTSGDIQTIDSLIKENKMPKLDYLYLSYDNLDNLELDTLETLESLNSIIHNVRDVSFYRGREYRATMAEENLYHSGPV